MGTHRPGTSDTQHLMASCLGAPCPNLTPNLTPPQLPPGVPVPPNPTALLPLKSLWYLGTSLMLDTALVSRDIPRHSPSRALPSTPKFLSLQGSHLDQGDPQGATAHGIHTLPLPLPPTTEHTHTLTSCVARGCVSQSCTRGTALLSVQELSPNRALLTQPRCTVPHKHSSAPPKRGQDRPLSPAVMHQCPRAYSCLGR